MKFYSWNINGIRAVWNKGHFQKFINDHSPDILCLQETKAQPHESPVDLSEYHEFWNSAEKKGYSGTAIFSKNKPLEVRYGFSEKIQKEFIFEDRFGDTTKEGRLISARFEDYWIVTVYTPNSKDKLERLNLRHKVWDPAFLLHIKELEKDAPVLFSGDLNVAHQEIDLARPKQNTGEHGFTYEEREGIDKILASGFVDSFRKLHPSTEEAYTWWTHWGNSRARNVGWRIDYWMVSEQLSQHLIKAEIHSDVMGSDHCPVSIELQ